MVDADLESAFENGRHNQADEACEVLATFSRVPFSARSAASPKSADDCRKVSAVSVSEGTFFESDCPPMVRRVSASSAGTGANSDCPRDRASAGRSPQSNEACGESRREPTLCPIDTTRREVKIQLIQQHPPANRRGQTFLQYHFNSFFISLIFKGADSKKSPVIKTAANRFVIFYHFCCYRSSFSNNNPFSATIGFYPIPTHNQARIKTICLIYGDIFYSPQAIFMIIVIVIIYFMIRRFITFLLQYISILYINFKVSHLIFTVGIIKRTKLRGESIFCLKILNDFAMKF